MTSEKIRDDNDEIEIDLYAFLMKLKSSWKKIILGMLLGALLSGIYSIFGMTPVYESTSSVYLRGNGTSISLQDLQVGTQLTKDYEIIFKSRPILESTIKEIGLDMKPEELAKAITISNPTDSRILEITAKADSPDTAKDIANSIMKNGIDTVLEIDAQAPYVIEKAIVNPIRVGMSRSKMVLLGAIIGALFVIVISFIRFILSDNIKSADDIERMIGIPVLSIVPEDDMHRKTKGKK